MGARDEARSSAAESPIASASGFARHPMGNYWARRSVRRRHQPKAASDVMPMAKSATLEGSGLGCIAEYRASGKSVPPAAAKLRQRLGFVLSYHEAPRDLIEHNPELVKEYIDQIERSITTLQQVLTLQSQAS